MVDKKKSERNIVPSEIGSTGVYSRGDSLYYQDSIKELTFPHSLITYDKMAMNVSIASALSAVTTIANSVDIYIEAYDQTPQHVKRADFVMQCFDDMDNETLSNVVQKALTFNKYGFSILEKVFRRRRFKNGSKYDDGKIGIKYLPMRKQQSIVDFKWDDEYRNFLGVYQNTTNNSSFQWLYSGDRTHLELKPKYSEDTDVFIPRNRILLFKSDVSTDLPQSTSPLFYAYEGWRELQKHKDMENIAASKNMNGILVGRAPEDYLSEDADPNMKKAGKAFKDGLTKVTINEQGCILLPSTRSDDPHGSLEWDVTTLQSSSSHVTSISSIVQRIQNEILQLMFADILRSGDDIQEVNSNKKSLLNRLVEIRIKEILKVLNTDLIPELFRRNGWDDSKLPTLRYGELKETDMAVFAKAMQQLKATKLIPITPSVINRVLEVMGFTYRVPDDMSKEELDKLLGVEDTLDSKSGTGMSSETGGLNGQGNSVSESDNSADNLSNK